MRSRSILLALSLVLAAQSARADDYDQAAKDLARGYAEEGIALHESGDYSAAVQSFTKAYRVLGAPTVGIRLARSLAKLGRLVEAAKAYQAVIDTPVKKSDPPVFAQAVTDAGAELAALKPRIPTLKITVAPGVTSPTLDGKPIAEGELGQPVAIDPGAHRVGGIGAAPEALELREGESATLALKAQSSAVTATATQPGSGMGWRRIAGISGVGLAGVSLVVGVVGSLQVNSTTNDPEFDAARRAYPTSNDVCVAAVSDPRFRSVIESTCSKGKTGTTLQLVFYPAALVLGGVGTYFLLTSGKSSSPKPAQVQFLPHVGVNAGGLDVIGSF